MSKFFHNVGTHHVNMLMPNGAPVSYSPSTTATPPTPAPYTTKPAPPLPYKPKPIPPVYPESVANCSVSEISETAEVCVPAFETNCTDVEVDTKIIVEKQQCNTITRTICTESTRVIPNKIHSCKYQEKTDDTVATTVEVTYEKSEHTTYVSQCEPVNHYLISQGFKVYGDPYCKDVPQISKYNSPVVTPNVAPVKVTFPEAKKKLIDKPISVPTITCENISVEKCITVPAIGHAKISVTKCDAKLAAPACSNITLTLPKEVCIQTAPTYSHYENNTS